MEKQQCATLDSAKRLAIFEKFERKLKGAPLPVLSLLEKAWDKEQEIFEISIPNTKAGAAAKITVVLGSHGLHADPKPFAKPLVASLRRLRKLLRDDGTRKQLIRCAERVRPLLARADKSFLTHMVETVLVAIEHDYSEFGQQEAGASGAGRRAGKTRGETRNVA